MGEFLEGLASPSWWMGVVIVGILINILSAYLKNPLDKFLSSIFSGWREHNERKSKERRELIDTLKSDETLLILFALTENRYRVRSIGFLLLAFALFFGATLLVGSENTISIVGLIISLLAALVGLHDHSEAMGVYSIVRSSNDKYNSISA